MLANYFLLSESCLIDDNNKPKEKAIYTIDCLVEMQIPFCILTSNSKFTLDDLTAFYHSIGFYSLKRNHFYSSSMAAVDYIVSSSEKRYEVHLGGAGLKEALEMGQFVTSYEKCDFVFIGSNHQANYDDYSELLNCIFNGAKILCLDHSLYEEGKQKKYIGAGAITLMLEAASKKKAIHFSLPSRIIIERAMKYLGCDSSETLIVGTDINKELLSSIKLEYNTAIVSSHFNVNKDIMTLSEKPIYYLSNLSSILD